MIDAPGTLSDGDFSIVESIGPMDTWFDEEKRTLMFRQQYECLASVYTPALIGSAGPRGSFLIEESQPGHVGTGVVRWTRTFAQLPPSRSIPQSDTHTYQLYIDGKVVGMSLGVTAFVLKEYFHTADPSTISLAKAYALIQVTESEVIIRGTYPLFSPGTYILGKDQQLNKWRGNFWERQSVMVPADPFSTFTP